MWFYILYVALDRARIPPSTRSRLSRTFDRRRAEVVRAWRIEAPRSRRACRETISECLTIKRQRRVEGLIFDCFPFKPWRGFPSGDRVVDGGTFDTTGFQRTQVNVLVMDRHRTGRSVSRRTPKSDRQSTHGADIIETFSKRYWIADYSKIKDTESPWS